MMIYLSSREIEYMKHVNKTILYGKVGSICVIETHGGGVKAPKLTKM